MLCSLSGFGLSRDYVAIMLVCVEVWGFRVVRILRFCTGFCFIWDSDTACSNWFHWLNEDSYVDIDFQEVGIGICT